MHYLIICIGDLRVIHKLVEHMPVLDFRDPEYRMIASVLLSHSLDDPCHIMDFLVILGFGPVIGSVGEKFIIYLPLVVIGIKQVFEIVETYYIWFFTCIRID